MGIDIGSVSTNFVVIDPQGAVMKEIYVKTDARPVEVVDAGLAEVRDELGDRITPARRGHHRLGPRADRRAHAGPTSSPTRSRRTRPAPTSSAASIGRQVDTIFEIGGQDSKFISLQDGIVVDFAMNEACAAGTGSFLEEQAEKLGISIKDEFARLALSSAAPVRLGERCTVFMERDVMAYQQRGARREDLVAGLGFSIAYNYLNRLVRERTVGDCIFFQGGTAYNDAVAAAFSQILQKDDHRAAAQRRHGRPGHGPAGARAHAAHRATPRGSAAGTSSRWTTRCCDFVCKRCSNECDVRQFTIEGEKTYWGDKCSDRYRKRAKVDKEPVIEDLIAFREQRCWRPTRRRCRACRRTRRTVGLPRSHVHLRPAALLVDVLRAPGLPPGALAGERPDHPRDAAWTPPWPSRASPSAWPTVTWQWLVRAGRGLRLRAQSDQRGDRVPASTTRTPARGARRCPSWCARRRAWRSTATAS